MPRIIQLILLRFFGWSVDLFLASLIILSSIISLEYLILASLMGFIFLAGPRLIPELLWFLLIPAVAHYFKRNFLGSNRFFNLGLVIIGILMFYLLSDGSKIISGWINLMGNVTVSIIWSIVYIRIWRMFCLREGKSIRII